jgi:hypothetical protein
MEQKYKKLFERFYFIQCEKYFETTGKEVFETEAEEYLILRAIRDGWNKYIESKKENLLTMQDRDIGNFFEAVDLEFPRYTHAKDDNALSDDDIGESNKFADEDFDEDLIGDEDEEFEFLEDELNRLSDELNAIPEDEREDVMMLMLGFPALQEVGFPVDVFMGGDGSTQLTDKQRQQIDWARQLAYKIVEMVEEENPTEKRKKNHEIIRFAAVFVPAAKIGKVVEEIRTAYERGRRMG